MVSRYLARACAEIDAETRETVIRLEIERLDHLHESLTKRLDQATTDEAAAKLSLAILRVAERRARLLGLDLDPPYRSRSIRPTRLR